jgi:hypothetical protein
MVRRENAATQSGPVRALQRRLRATIEQFHPEPSIVRSDAELFRALVALYPLPLEAIWRHAIELFVSAQMATLPQLYAEHAAWPAVRVLDLAEALLVLERLDHDVRRLERAWPLAPSLLDEVASAWGAPVGQSA